MLDVTKHAQYYTPSGIYVTEEERAGVECAQKFSGIWDEDGNAFYDPAAETLRLLRKYNVSTEAGLDISTGQFWVPHSRPWITWFDDSPDVGPGCLCSLCMEPIEDIAIRYADTEDTRAREARFHFRCAEEATRGRPNAFAPKQMEHAE